MARNKPLAKKLRLINREKSNSPIPVWVIAKTMRRIRYRPRLRLWRRSKLKDV
ncbi:MAG: 50S ribosomal protein L39e [Desulfurococcales archaeon]|jgi:large subunit ribosomal protein L39e|nr:50S ribosomal protein L39e [Desulfurococcales archaeon]